MQTGFRSALFFLLAAFTTTQSTNAAEPFKVERLAAPGGEVVFANPDEKDVMHDQLTYASARRAGDFVYLAGVEAGPLPGEGNVVEIQMTAYAPKDPAQ